MPPTPSPKILAFVEGMMERIFINANFPYVELVGIDNGAGWSPERLYEQIATKFCTKNVSADRIVVWLDAEKQTISMAQFRSGIIRALQARGADPEKIAVYIPNRMTENVILADEKTIQEEFSLPNYTYDLNGKNGKAVLNGMYRGKGVNYKETQQGVRLLKKLRLDRAATNCERLKVFIDELGIPCWWI